MIIVGLTGGIATGKSTVSKRLEEKHKISIIDADFIARDVVAPGKRAYKQVVEAFSDVPDLVNASDKSLNRPALGKAVFGKKDRLSVLNSIVHPAVRKEILWQIFLAYISFKDMVILDVPLLFESGLYQLCGATVTVHCDKKLQLERLLIRNPTLSLEDAEHRVNSQMSAEERNYRADIVIDNNKGLNQLKESVDSIVTEIKPNGIWTLIDLFPPFGIASALYTIVIRTLRDKYKGIKPPGMSQASK